MNESMRLALLYRRRELAEAAKAEPGRNRRERKANAQTQALVSQIDAALRGPVERDPLDDDDDDDD